MKRILLLIGLLFVWIVSYGQTYTFTNAGATGHLGPSQADITSAYSSTNLNAAVTSLNGIQQWIVPSGGSYMIKAIGASGGGVNGGSGADMEGVFNLTGGDTLFIVVGQAGFDVLDGSASGGGGSYVVLSDPSSSTVTSTGRGVTPLIIAGGGGANPGVANPDCNGSITTAGKNGSGGNGSGIGGTNGNGGGISVPNGNNRGGGGGGFLTDGERTGTCTNNGEESGASFLNGSVGGLSVSCGSAQGPGGFGGGGASISTGWRSSGGGGGYSGGGGGQTNSVATTHRAGGGGSFNSGQSQNNTVSTTMGHGQVIITALSSCGSPNNLNVNVVTCDSLILEWTNAADSALVFYGSTGTPPTGGSLVVGDSSLTITGTTPNTTYDFYVVNICGSDTSSLAGPFTVSTGTTGAPIADFSANSPAFNTTVNFDASLSSGTSNTYAWDFGDGNTGIGLMTTHTYTIGGNYNVELTVTNDCGLSDTTIALNSVGLKEGELVKNLSIYPNPVADKLHITFEASQQNYMVVRILDISGREVLTRSVDAVAGKFDFSIDLSALAKGAYVLEISSGMMKMNQKLLKQ